MFKAMQANKGGACHVSGGKHRDLQRRNRIPTNNRRTVLTMWMNSISRLVDILSKFHPQKTTQTLNTSEQAQIENKKDKQKAIT